MGRQRMKLGNICDFVYGNGLPEVLRRGGDVPVYGSNGIVGWHNQALTKGETIIIGRKGSIGEVQFSELPCWPIDTTYFVETTKKPYNLRLLYYMLIALDLTRLNKSAAVPGINRDDAYEKEIPLYSPAEQQYIANILTKADRLRQLRRYALELSGTYLQSVFLEMFGDPGKNLKKWSIGRLYQLCSKVVDCPHSTPIYESAATAYACIRSSDIQGGVLDWSTTKYVDYQEYQKRIHAHIPKPNEIVYCREGARFGNAAIIQNGRKVCLGQRMMLFQADTNVATPEFIWAFLESESTRRQANRLAGGSASPHLNVGDINEFLTIIPPLPLQQNFSRLVQKYERLLTQQKEAERQAEHLFQTLLYKAFQGELTVDEIDEMEKEIPSTVAHQEMSIGSELINMKADQLVLPLE